MKKKSEIDPLMIHEVVDMTNMLRDEPDSEYIRDFVKSRGLDPEEVLLAGFVEDEDWGEYGCLVTYEGTIYHYERRLEEHPEGARLNVWENCTGKQKVYDDWPWVKAAIHILANPNHYPIMKRKNNNMPNK